ncbi:MAG: hypothetical protein J1F12_08255 [Muribaculaceae bacterium]|nr:hypothetical protein [Muribaculaceae bacterium]
MKNSRALSLFIGGFLIFGGLNALSQNAFNQNRTNVQRNNNAFNKDRKNNFNDYRHSLNSEYAKKLGGRWNNFNSFRGEEIPKDNSVPPIVWNGNKDKEKEDKQVVIEEVITPKKDNTTPSPIAPIKEEKDQPSTNLDFTFFGTPLSVRVPVGKTFRLGGTSAEAASQAWMQLSDPEYAALVSDCLKLKSKYRMGDWEYLLMLDALAKKLCPDPNSATFLMAYLYGQSGYKIRLANNDSGKLDMLFASKHSILRRSYYKLDGEKFYPFYGNGGDIYISEAKFSKEQPLSLWINSEPLLSESISNGRNRKAQKFPDMNYNVGVNENIIKFYDTYPSSYVGDNIMTRWAMYANTPMTKYIKDNLYPKLKASISGLGELEATEKLLNWVQTGFEYGYDDKIWGYDRPFFAEESIYYPYCDCEDRAILFTKLVRDLIGLDCILVYYPNHLAAAVNFNNPVRGDYIQYQNKRFTITDPTYIGAPVGDTMPNMDNSSAKVILLEK